MAREVGPQPAAAMVVSFLWTPYTLAKQDVTGFFFLAQDTEQACGQVRQR